MMNKNQITLIIFGFLILALMATNPSIDDHRQAVLSEIKNKITESSSFNNKWEQLGQQIGFAIGQGIIEKAIARENYLLFSLTKISFGNKSRKIGFGILGSVFINDYNTISESIMSNNLKYNSNKKLEKSGSAFIGCWANEWIILEISEDGLLKIHRKDISDLVGGNSPIQNAKYVIHGNKIKFINQRLLEENYYEIVLESGEYKLVEQLDNPRFKNEFIKTDCNY